MNIFYSHAAATARQLKAWRRKIQPKIEALEMLVEHLFECSQCNSDTGPCVEGELLFKGVERYKRL